MDPFRKLRPLTWKGIVTPKQDVDLIKRRYKEAKELEENKQEN